MSLEWKTVELKSIVDVTMGQSPKSEFYNDNFEGMPFLQGNKTFGDKYPSFELYTTSIKKVAKKNSVLMSVRAPVGDLNIAREDICIGRGVCGLQMKKGDNEFLYYLLKANISHLINKESGTVFGSINKNDIETFEVTLPEDFDDQMKILTILKNIDKKIDVCKDLNKNLEQLIKYIHINWFEEFEPFKDMNFYDTKLGSIPVGWDVKPLQDFIKFQEGPGIRNWQYVEEDGINFLNIRCIQNNDLVLDTANMISKEEANGKYSHFMLNEWDLVISSSGTLGRYAIVREEHLPLCLNTSIIRFTPLHSFDHYAYVYSYLTSRGFYHYLLTMGSGSVQLNF